MAVRKAELAMLCFYDVRDFRLFKFFWKEGGREKLKTQERGNDQYINLPEEGGDEI